MTAAYGTALREWHNPTVEEVVDTLLHGLVRDARDLRLLAGTERYTKYLRENKARIEEAADQLRAALEVLERTNGN